MSDSNLIADLAAAGLDPQLLQRVVMEIARAQANNEAIERRRASDRERQERRRHVTSRDVTGHNVTSADKDARSAPPHAEKLTSKTRDNLDHTSEAKASSGPKPSKRKRDHALPDDFEPGPLAEKARQELGRSVEWMRDCLAQMRAWAIGGGHVRSQWDAVLDGWMRREAKREPVQRPPPRAGPERPQRSADFWAETGAAAHARIMERERDDDHDPHDGRDRNRTDPGRSDDDGPDRGDLWRPGAHRGFAQPLRLVGRS